MRPIIRLFFVVLLLSIVFVFNEFLIYSVIIRQCDWPKKIDNPVKVMMISDTHLLGPINGQWLDKLRHEWQMYKAFEVAVQLHRPDVVFIMGDIFNEGEYVDDEYFVKYMNRFHELFDTSDETIVYSIIGNHDIGFHKDLNTHKMNRFEEAFIKSGNSLLTIRDVHFVQLNSMTMSLDGCIFCTATENQLKNIARNLDCAKNDYNETKCTTIDQKIPSYSKPILLQHFPTYRPSDENCTEGDIAEMEIYKESWDVLSKNATEFLGDLFNFRVSFSGHSHHYCKIVNTLGIEEYTIASFNWRNKDGPSFLLAEFSPSDYAVLKCNMPRESFVIILYIFVFVVLIYTIVKIIRNSRRKSLRRFLRV